MSGRLTATLAFPDWDKDFYLQTDASGLQWAPYCCKETEELRPIAYFSSGLTESQKKHSAGELECLALIAASRKFRKYLQAANKVHFISDHNPLCWLCRQKDPRHKFARWIQELESFDYEVQYVQGAVNNVADYLSRLDSEVDMDVNNEEEYFERHIFSTSDGELDMNKLRDDQNSDPAISFAVNSWNRVV